MIIFVLFTLVQTGVAKNVSAGRKPRGLSSRDCGIQVKTAASVGETHEAGSETASWPMLVLASQV